MFTGVRCDHESCVRLWMLCGETGGGGGDIMNRGGGVGEVGGGI